MADPTPTAFPPTLVFTSVDGFLDAVQRRSIDEIACATLKRVTPFAEGMLQRHTSFMLLTARDHRREEILACSVFLQAGDFVDDHHRFTPAKEWERQNARAETMRHQVLRRLHAVPTIQVVDAAYHVSPDVCMRFAALPLEEPGDASST
jgi:hypothetical protein